MAKKSALAIARLIPDSKIERDLHDLLVECRWQVELSGTTVPVAEGSEFKVIERIYIESTLEIGFGSHYRVLIAVGGLESVEHGIVIPNTCFALFYYSSSYELLTFDFMAKNWWTSKI